MKDQINVSRYRWTDAEKEAILLQLLDDVRPKTIKAPQLIAVGETIDGAQKFIAHKGQLNGLSTGYHLIDEWTGGLGEGQVFLIFADTGIGKSLLAQNVAINVAEKGDVVCFVGLEMTNDENTARFITMTSEETVAKLPILYPGEDQEIGINDLDALYSSAVKEGAKLMIIDHLHAMPLPSASSEASGYDALVWAIKRTTRRYRIPTILLAHISYSAKGKKGHPDLSDLKGSSSIKQCADVALTLARDMDDEPQTLFVQLAKIRGRQWPSNRNASLTLLDNARLADRYNGPFPIA